MIKAFSWFSVMAVVIAGAVVPVSSFAQTTTSTISSSAQAQIDLITNLSKQIQALQQQAKDLQSQKQTATAQLVSSLSLGSKGDQVKVLQALLAADASIYPEGLITGYFGPATQRAVKQFQKKNGIEQVGNVGPKTLKKFNELFGLMKLVFEAQASSTATSTAPGNSGKLCVFIPPGHLIAPGWLRKHGNEQVLHQCGRGNHNDEDNDDDHHGTSTLDTIAPVISAISTSVGTSTASISWATNEPANSQVFYGLTSSYGSSTSQNSSLLTSRTMVVTGLTPGTVYHFSVRSTDASGNAATSADQTFTTGIIDAVAPVISNVGVSVGTSTAVITWVTNEGANSQVSYGLTSGYGSSTAQDASMVTSHSQTLTGLTPGTLYHFSVRSADIGGNIATSSDQTFTTNAVDATAPTISGITLSIGSSTANVSWVTNEAANGKIYYGATAPIDLTSTSTLSLATSTLSTSHAFTISGLSASTTYYYVIASADALANTATSTQQSFTTTQ